MDIHVEYTNAGQTPTEQSSCPLQTNSPIYSPASRLLLGFLTVTFAHWLAAVRAFPCGLRGVPTDVEGGGDFVLDGSVRWSRRLLTLTATGWSAALGASVGELHGAVVGRARGQGEPGTPRRGRNVEVGGRDGRRPWLGRVGDKAGHRGVLVFFFFFFCDVGIAQIRRSRW